MSDAPWFSDNTLVAQWLRALDDLTPYTARGMIRAVECAHKYSREEVEAAINRYLEADAA